MASSPLNNQPLDEEEIDDGGVSLSPDGVICVEGCEQ